MSQIMKLKRIPMQAIYMWAGFFANPARSTEIEAEMKADFIPRFTDRYRELAGQNAPMPPPKGPPLTILKDTADKWGTELRLYFMSDRNVWIQLPDPTVEVTRDTRWSSHKKGPYHRISVSGFVAHMFDLGFYLGPYKHKRDYQRIRANVPEKFLAAFDKGYELM